MMRTQYEGALNVLRFNWPRYAFGVFVVLVTATGCLLASGVLSVAFAVIASLALLALLLPFIATHYIYDRSSLYAMPWLKSFDTERPEVLLNITAGFDESSALLHERFPGSNLHVVDFFDPQLHTEPSIARARNAYPPFPGTRYTVSQFVMARSRHTAHRAKRIVSRAFTTSKSSPALGLS